MKFFLEELQMDFFQKKNPLCPRYFSYFSQYQLNLKKDLFMVSYIIIYKEVL
jgi:hypothetical protein